MMLRKKDKWDMIEAGYNRYAHNDNQEILPKWCAEQI